MTAIKHTLQRQVFLPSEERLIAVVHVTKTGRKKKASFLCAAGMLSIIHLINYILNNQAQYMNIVLFIVTTEKPVQTYIYQVKKSEKGDNNFKKKLQWSLRELKFIDGKDARKVCSIIV